ncbi:MAG: BTAD domain-containing putative transcriptional regulator, partial [Acidimicrobiia bacterium]
MRFEMLGPLRVLDVETEVDVGGPRQRTVLAILLASHPDPVSVDRLVNEVWDGDAPGTADHVIRTYISNLRGVLGDRIVSDGHRYHLDLTQDTTDTAELADALAQGRALLDVDAAAAHDRLAPAVALHRGRPFDGSSDVAPTVRIMGDAFEEQYLQAVETRIEAALRLGRHEQVLPDIESHVRSHPHREHAAGQLMLALYRSGRQADALGVFRDLRHELVEQHGIDPSPELEDLEQRILLQDAGLSLRPPHNVPAPISSFIGRLAELGEITKQIETFRLVTLTGAGGVGKTRLAREAAIEVLDDFPDGVWWIDVAAVEDPGDVVERTAQVLGVPAQPGRTLADVLGRYLSVRTTLLVFDNCEHLTPGIGGMIAALLDAGPEVKVLATSRRPLDVGGELRSSVPPMSLPVLDDPDYVPGTSDAERLFRARVEEATSVSMWRSPDAAEDSARICVRLDGIPLAIEMAAARTTVLSPGQISARLEEGTDLLVSSEVDRHPRQRTLEATMEWSYALLDVAERAVFERVSVFVSSFDIDAAQAVAGFEPVNPDDVLNAIAGIVSASMLVAERTTDTMRYRMLATMREFARRKLEASGVVHSAEQRHAHHHIGLAAAAGGRRFTPSFTDAMARLEA